jgi:hypothetical protein
MGDFGTADPNANVELKSKFRLEIDGIDLMAVEGVKLGALKWGEITNRTGVEPLTQQTSTGLMTPSDITIKKVLRVGGFPDVVDFYSWYFEGSKRKASGSVVILDRDDVEVGRINFRECFVNEISELDFEALAEADGLEFTFVLRTPTYEVVAA